MQVFSYKGNIYILLAENERFREETVIEYLSQSSHFPVILADESCSWRGEHFSRKDLAPEERNHFREVIIWPLRKEKRLSRERKMPGGLTTASGNAVSSVQKKSVTDTRAMENENRPYRNRKIRRMKGIITDTWIRNNKICPYENRNIRSFLRKNTDAWYKNNEVRPYENRKIQRMKVIITDTWVRNNRNCQNSRIHTGNGVHLFNDADRGETGIGSRETHKCRTASPRARLR